MSTPPLPIEGFQQGYDATKVANNIETTKLFAKKLQKNIVFGDTTLKAEHPRCLECPNSEDDSNQKTLEKVTNELCNHLHTLLI